jgi:hypothetical protein
MQWGGAAPTSIVAHWDNLGTPQAMTVVTTKDEGDGLAFAGILYLANPHPGAKQLSVSWSGATDYTMSAMSFTGGGSFANAVTNSGNSNAPTIAVSSAPGHFAVGSFASNNSSFSTTSFSSGTKLYALNTNVSGTAGYIAGAASVSITPTTLVAINPWAAVGVDILPAPGNFLGKTPPRILRPGLGPSRGLVTRYAYNVPSQGDTLGTTIYRIQHPSWR